MNEKDKLIILYLHSNMGYTQCSTLAQYLSVSERSIKRYIKSINKEYEDAGVQIDSKKGLGYKLLVTDQSKFQRIIKDVSITAQEESGRTLELLRSLLKVESISLDDLSEKLFASRSTLQNELNIIRNLLEAYRLQIKYKPYKGLYVEGDEEDIRKSLVKYFFAEDKGYDLVLQEPLGKVTKACVDYVHTYIEKSILASQRSKNQYEINYLAKFAAVSLFRADEGHLITSPIKQSELKKVDQLFDEDFRQVIAREYGIEVPEPEVLYMNLLGQLDEGFMMNKRPSFEEISKVIHKAVTAIDYKYKIHLEEDLALVESLTKHVDNSYHRYYLKLDVENHVIDQVKKGYPEAFYYAQELAQLLEETFGVTISPNERGYIAVHFATAIERAKQKTRYHTVIVCNTGLGTSELLKTKLRRYFPEIKVIACCQPYYLQRLDMTEVDFVLSTIPLEAEQIGDKEMVLVSHILDESDIKSIEDKIGKVYLEQYLKTLFHAEIFYPKVVCKNKNELLEWVTEDMVQKGFITSDNRGEILKREKLSSTEISDLVAVPHCISKESKNAIAICALKNPVKWGKSRVKLVLIACLDSQIKDNKHVFPFIHNQTRRAEQVNLLCESFSLDEWLGILMRSTNYDS
ncbi:MAG: BglG family transcription antiterminator [Cellulosilyticaceae bacterium]